MKDNKRNIIAYSEFACSGCGACTSVCPKKAIKLKLNNAGFYTAVVDESCVNCGLCQRVCNRYDSEIAGISLHDAALYALQSKNSDVVQQCSSGGIAHELAMQAIKDRKKVIGVVYNTKNNQAEHRITEGAEQIIAFDGSKYIQSNPEKAFRQALDLAKQNSEERYVVFGTPCQIAGLAKSCQQIGVRERFLLVEIFCHGVPSYKLWNEECRRISKKLGISQFDSVQFRYKKDDWHSYCLRVDAGNKTFFGAREKEIFWQVFFENILLGDSCYKCRMRKEISMADIRLGDYWGQRYQHRSDGVSAAFACTKQGKEAIDRLKQLGIVDQLDAGSADEMLAAQNMDGYHQQELHDRAMKILSSENDVHKAIRAYRKEMTVKQKLKRILLSASSIIPDNARAKLRKANSSRMLRK